LAQSVTEMSCGASKVSSTCRRWRGHDQLQRGEVDHRRLHDRLAGDDRQALYVLGRLGDPSKAMTLEKDALGMELCGNCCHSGCAAFLAGNGRRSGRRW